MLTNNKVGTVNGSGYMGTTNGTVHIGDQFIDLDRRANEEVVTVLSVGTLRATILRGHTSRHTSVKIDRLLNKSRFTRIV